MHMKHGREQGSESAIVHRRSFFTFPLGDFSLEREKEVNAVRVQPQFAAAVAAAVAVASVYCVCSHHHWLLLFPSISALVS